MQVGKRFGLVMMAVGIVALGASFYIRGEVGEGREKISRAQRSVDQGNRLFNLTPVTKEVGRGITGSAQRRIDEGKLEIQYYNNLAGWLQIGGIVFIVVGAGIAIVSKKK